MKHLQFIDEYGSFSIKQPENTSYLYFPLASETGLKSSLTPNLGGDSKTDQETFLLEPVSAENLHNNRSVRNFWLVCEKEGSFSATGASAKQEAVKFTALQDQSKITAGFMWHTLERFSSALDVYKRQKQRTTCTIASTSRMLARNWFPRPSPFDAPFTSPAISTNSMAAGMIFFV